MYVLLTVDLEPDCPPYLWTWRGMSEGFPRLRSLLRAEGVPATFFSTGSAARAYPGAMEQLLTDGHELGCHGMSHSDFTKLGRHCATEEIAQSVELLRSFSEVRCFRAPYLRFPEEFLDLLPRHGISIDASLARYKPRLRPPKYPPGLTRVWTSTTSSLLRLPAILRDPILSRMSSPVVLFVHPWEFVDLRGTRLRWDCRFRTGEPAIESLRTAIRLYKQSSARFLTLSEAVSLGLYPPPPSKSPGAFQ